MTALGNVKEIGGYQFRASDRLFLDANIWLFLHGPQKPKSPPHVKTYSGALKRILDAKSGIFIDALIASEVINRYARLKHRLVKPNSGFKQFRDSPCFEPVAQEIAEIMRRILRNCSCIESGFSTLNVDDMLKEYAGGSSDFNDQVIEGLCKSMCLTLVTHDADFKTPHISILTANRKMLV